MPDPMPLAPPTTSKRLVIHHLELRNFKSYYGTVRIGPFHPRFTCIVGPNGSGKSNIIDAMLFVFGKKAQQLRMKKVTDLIHKSASHPDCDSCSVEVVFTMLEYKTGANGSVPTQASEYESQPESGFRIGREAKADGSSQYILNGAKVKRDRIVSQLMDHGIDLEHNRFLILQGEVEQVALLNPIAKRNLKGDIVDGGLLEFLEDVIGSSTFQESITATEQQLNESEIDLKQKRAALDKMEARMKEKEKTVRDNVALCKLRCQAHKWKVISLRQRAEKHTDQRKELKKKIELVKERYAAWKEKTKGAKELITGAETTLLDTRKELKKLEKAKGNCEAKIENESNEHDRMTVHQKALKREIKEFEKEIEAQNEKKQKMEDELQKAEANIPALKDELERNEAVLAATQEEYERMNRSLESNLSVLRTELTRAQEEALPKKEAFKDAEIKMRSLHKQVASIEAKLDKDKNSLEKNLAKIKELEQELKSVSSASKARKADLLKKEKEHRKACEASEEFTNSKYRLDEDYNKIKNKYEELKRRADHQADNQKTNKLESRLQMMSQQNEIQGFRGNLWDSVTVLPEYEVALAAFTNKQAWVCESKKTAEDIIEVVKRERLGRVTCIVLPEVVGKAQRSMNKIEDLRRKLPRGGRMMIDCFDGEIPPDLYPAVVSKLGQMIVADSHDQAKEFALRHRWGTTFTREGYSVQTNGVESGGHVRVHKKTKQAEPVDHNELQRIHTELQRLNDSKTNHRENMEQENARADRLHREIRSMKDDLEQEEAKLSEVRFELESRTSAMNKRKDEKMSPEEKELLEAKMAALREEAQGLEGSLDRLKGEMTAAENVCEEVQSRIDECGGTEMQELKASMTTARMTKESKKKELEKSKKQITKYTAKIKDVIETIIPDNAAKIEVHTVDIERLVARRAAIENQSKLLIEKTKGLEDLIEGKTKAVEEQVQALRDLQTVDDEAEREKADIEEVKSVTILEYKEVFSKIKGYEMQVQKEVAKWSGIPSTTEIERLYNRNEDPAPGEEPSRLSIAAPPTGDEENQKVPSEDGHDKVADPARQSTVQRLFSETGEVMDEDKELVLGLTGDELAMCNHEVANVMVEKTMVHLQKFSSVDISVFDEFTRIVKSWKDATEEHDHFNKVYVDLAEVLSKLEIKRFDLFTEGFDIINAHLQELYRMITLGGTAELQMINRDHREVFKTGIELLVRPPGKSYCEVSKLSGGEKTLSSLSLIFALHHFRASPIYFLDEIDAALDYKNVAIIARTLALRTSNAQFMIISLRNQMFQKADRLIGTYKINDSSGFTSMDFNEEQEDREAMGDDPI